eukprot:Colp12_sorted_trinity150504_noHs@28643
MSLRDKKDEDEGEVNPFLGLEKSSVLQEARGLFSKSPVNARKCIHVLTKLLFIIYQGEQIGKVEATEAFFAVTKLFQSKDVTLRRLVYLTIKEMSSMADDVIIVTSSLTKDMTGREDMYRASAIRALIKITDASMLAGIERYLKQAIVDKDPAVASAALTSSLHLMRENHEVVKRWVNEVQEAANSKATMVQYHALGVLYQIKQRDRLAVSKLVSGLTRGGVRSAFGYVMAIRYAARVILDDNTPEVQKQMQEFLDSCLRHKSEMVWYEAARTICSLPNKSLTELVPAIAALQLSLSSPKPTQRFAAVRTLSRVAMTHPLAVTSCNLDMENLISDSNRSIATLAITTLLKTGNSASVDRLMKQISSFMSEISDEFKVVVVEAIRALCLKFPQKQQVMMNFLASILREEGGFEYKKAIVDTIIAIISEIPESKETGLAQLCEFIEDCEFANLSSRILHLLGKEGPQTANPSKYIRYIYNRIILENSVVRAAAVSALAKFASQSEALLPSILVLLSRCLYDTDDEVRDRACLYLDLLSKERPLAAKYILEDLPFSVVGLERSLEEYVKSPSATPFDIRLVPVAAPAAAPAPKVGKSDEPAAAKKATVQASAAASTQDAIAAKLAAVPALARLGPLFKSSKAVELTEPETEYAVKCIKHIFPRNLVLEYECTNTLNDQLLENVTVAVTPEDGFVVQGAIPLERLPFDKPLSTYVVLALPEDGSVSGTFSNTLKFIVKDCDPATGEPDEQGYDDEYLLEDLEVTASDHILPVGVNNFGAAWDELGADAELEETFELTAMKSLEESVTAVIGYLGMQPCERSDKIPAGKASHTLVLSGLFRGGQRALVRARMAYQAASGVTMQLAVRSTSPEVSEIIMSCVS